MWGHLQLPAELPSGSLLVPRLQACTTRLYASGPRPHTSCTECWTYQWTFFQTPAVTFLKYQLLDSVNHKTVEPAWIVESDPARAEERELEGSVASEMAGGFEVAGWPGFVVCLWTVEMVSWKDNIKLITDNRFCLDNSELILTAKFLCKKKKKKIICSWNSFR